MSRTDDGLLRFVVQVLRESSDRSMAKLNMEISKLTSSIEDLRAVMNTKVRFWKISLNLDICV